MRSLKNFMLSLCTVQVEGMSEVLKLNILGHLLYLFSLSGVYCGAWGNLWGLRSRLRWQRAVQGRWCIFTCFVHRDNSWKPSFIIRTVPCNDTYVGDTPRHQARIVGPGRRTHNPELDGSANFALPGHHRVNLISGFKLHNSWQFRVTSSAL